MMKFHRWNIVRKNAVGRQARNFSVKTPYRHFYEKCVLYVLLVLVTISNYSKCQDNFTTQEPPLTTEEPIFATQEPIFIRGSYGGIYYNEAADNPHNIHYIHGTYQPPNKYYYSKEYHTESSTLDAYLRLGLSKMNGDFAYDDFHHYYHDINRNISDEDTLLNCDIVRCHPSAIFFCPENTETVCLSNGTVYCMAKIDAVVLCGENGTASCVNTTLPCRQDCGFESTLVPCLATVVIVDVHEINGTTIGRVGGSFILVPAQTQEERTFCVTVILDPTVPQPK